MDTTKFLNNIPMSGRSSVKCSRDVRISSRDPLQVNTTIYKLPHTITMCGILFHAHLRKTTETESEEFVNFLSRLRVANARRGQ